MSKFKVGDKVRVMHGEWDEIMPGDIGTVVGVNDSSIGIRVKGKEADCATFPGAAYYYPNELELVEEKECLEKLIKEPKGGIMSNIVNKVKQLALSADEKLLRKHGVVNDCGELTEEGEEILISVLFAEYRDKVVAAVKSVDEEEKKAKK